MTLMILARAWRRRTYASFAMTVVVPVALLASLAVLALSGGIPGLGSLRQAFSGPSGPAVATPVLGGSAAGSSAAAFRSGLPAPTAVGAASTAAIAPGHATTSGSLGVPRSPGSGAPSGAPGPARGGSGGGSSGGYPRSSQPSGKQPSSRPTVVDQVVGTVTPVTSSLPGPAGPAATHALHSGGALADRLLHDLPGR